LSPALNLVVELWFHRANLRIADPLVEPAQMGKEKGFLKLALPVLIFF
jgi:hypothetical protein